MNYYMNYLNDFNRWLESNSLESVSQLMYFKLLNVFNRAGWPESVQVDNPRLMSMTGCASEKSARAARDRLISAGLISYQRGKKGIPGRYFLIPIPRPKYGAESGPDSIHNVGQNLPGNFYPVNFAGNMGSNQGANRDVIAPGITPPYKEKEEDGMKIPPPPRYPDREEAAAGYDPAYGEVMAALLDFIPQASEIARGEMTEFYRELGRDVCLRAIFTARDERKSGFSYIRGILRRCRKEEIRTLADWDRAAQEKEARSESARARDEPDREAPSYGFKNLSD